MSNVQNRVTVSGIIGNGSSDFFRKENLRGLYSPKEDDDAD